ncbi:a-pheromone processing metallopeptidase ste23 [Rhodotorula toruloides]|uniref:A-pheromone processing metallopeptidase ste23 n=1 Tax=Rhodotorula toruloides TaxID=5286 RepID=A0A511KMV6_RHOTO|nr:a-pheromone processing metallopeptidase ste23 [Rhodotorula toruloides]
MQRATQPFDFGRLGSGWRTERGSFAVLEKDIEVSPNDDRQYRFIFLPNGLKALLISDSQTDKAAAALGVQVGHLNDPDDLPGLAHFCEHMLFLGTEKYPEEADYKRYLSRNAGSSNAYTSRKSVSLSNPAFYVLTSSYVVAETVYHFDCSPASLPGALSRHAQFFTSPLFNASCTERELNAVDSEFRRNLQLDTRRLFQLGKATSSREAGSVYWKFGTGSKESLWDEPRARGVDVRERLLEWYSKHYSANLMSLVVLGNQSLDELTRLVLREYSDIPNSNLEPSHFPVPPISPVVSGKQISYRTVKDTPRLRIEFGMPDLRRHWRTKPGRFVSHYLGHEGEGSVLAVLKSLGWANSLSSSSGGGGARGFDFFRVEISLTATGLQHYQEAIALVFRYIKLLKSTPPQRWAFEEIQQLGKIDWRWKEKGQPQSTTRNLASQIGETLYDPDKLLVGPWFATEWDVALIKKTMGYLRADNCRVFVGSKEPLPGREVWKEREKYYGTEYDVIPLDFDSLLSSSSSSLALPGRNIFVPEKLHLLREKPSSEPGKRPSLIRKTHRSRLFFKADDRWCIPKGSAFFIFRSPIADISPRTAILTQLFTSLVEESLIKYSYDATLAGLHYSFGTESGAFSLVVSGYTEKLPLLASVVLDTANDFQIATMDFEIVHDRLTRAYANAKLSNPSVLADAEIRRLTRQTYWTWDERLEALQGLTLADVRQHASQLLSKYSLDALVTGNFAANDAVEMVEMLEGKLDAQQADSSETDYHRALKLSPGSSTVYRPLVPSPENVNSAVSAYYDVGPTSDHQLLAKLSLFAQLAKVPVFSTLRTKEQLGYIVSSGSWVTNAYAGFRVVVQSERSPEYVDERIDALWSTFAKHIQDMSDEEFEKERESLVLKLLEKPKTQGQESNRYWAEVSTGEFDFDYRERQAKVVQQLLRSDILAFFNRFISPSSPSRAKLAILYRSQRLQPADLAPLLEAVKAATPNQAEEASTFAQTKPTIAQLEAFVKERYANESAVLAAFEEVKEPRPLPVGTKELREEDIEPFRRGLTRAEGYRPVSSDEDLQTAAHL